MKKLLKLTTKNRVFKLIAEDIKVFKAVFFVVKYVSISLDTFRANFCMKINNNLE